MISARETRTNAVLWKGPAASVTQSAVEVWHCFPCQQSWFRKAAHILFRLERFAEVGCCIVGGEVGLRDTRTLGNIPAPIT